MVTDCDNDGVGKLGQIIVGHDDGNVVFGPVIYEQPLKTTQGTSTAVSVQLATATPALGFGHAVVELWNEAPPGMTRHLETVVVIGDDGARLGSDDRFIRIAIPTGEWTVQAWSDDDGAQSRFAIVVPGLSDTCRVWAGRTPPPREFAPTAEEMRMGAKLHWLLLVAYLAISVGLCAYFAATSSWWAVIVVTAVFSAATWATAIVFSWWAARTRGTTARDIYRRIRRDVQRDRWRERVR